MPAAAVCVLAPRGRAAVRGRLLARLMPGSAIITLQLGQCGNQLGHELFATLAREAAAGARGGGAAGPAATGPATGPAAGSGEAAVDQLLPQFFRCGSQRDGDAASGLEGGLADDMAAPPVARSVLVDMEPKVIWQVVERASRSVAPGRWRYQPGGSYAQASGAGNNWAYGFAVHGPAASDSVMELVRKEAVRMTTFFEPFLSICIKTIILPRQARDKHRKSCDNKASCAGALRQAGRPHAPTEPRRRHRVWSRHVSHGETAR